ncbi:LacI family DNA-binding transcriptional regulator [Rhizobium sp. KVB221]|uniref:LacI family DNA-binding transcriptional regulator n=1 Tax=Rhizobium setariae TaxID=2801340 RepID=A0A936YLG9_9HYPH|nr:LacI family DNA-binding transcriptional regulator [Rhizobium setariae]MBL0372523.1 LacI family DNA-binding transcriptional regulator [Rhizobium setariae]
MASRPTISDLARAAGVSVATVDRVINGRHKVRPETSRRVHDAASEIGYLNLNLIHQPEPRQGAEYRLGLILPKPQSAFFQSVARTFEAAAATAPGIRAIVQIEYATELNPAGVAEMLTDMAARNQAIAITAPDYPAVTAAVEAAAARNIPVFSLFSDFASGVRAGYIGMNNRKAGRTAAWLIARTAKHPGKVAVLVGSHRLQGHELREIGFRSFFREKAPEFDVLNTLIDIDSAQSTYEQTAALIRQHPDLVGYYITGGAIEGAIAAIREARLGENLRVVVTELTLDSRAALADEIITMAISVPLQAVCRELVQLMIGAIDNGQASVAGQTFVPFELHLPESV